MRINEAIVLAAGASKRLGSPKALIEVKGQTLVELVCSKLQNAGLSVTVVTRKSLKQKIKKLVSTTIFFYAHTYTRIITIYQPIISVARSQLSCIRREFLRILK